MLWADEILVTASTLSESSGITVVDGVALVPTEALLLLSVSLPLGSANRRRETLPFALEEHVSQPLESLHFALGDAVAPGVYLAAAVDRGQMQAWIAALAELGQKDIAIVPDVLALPVPPEGHWAVEVDDARARVRFADGAGFATAADRLAIFWERAGRPMLLASGDALPAGLPPAEPLPIAPLPERTKHAALDLRQGEFAPARPLLGRYWRRAAIVTVCGLAAHAAIATADTFALMQIADERRAETETLVALARPGAYLGDDLVDIATTLLPESDAKPATFLPLLSRVSDALKPIGDAISFDSLRFVQKDGALALVVSSKDSATLDKAKAELRDAGLGVRAGMAVSTPTGVRADMIVEDGE